MKKSKFLSFGSGMLFFLVLFLGCEEDSTFKIEESQQIIFHYSYENYAWGYQFFGWCIDKEGVVWDLEEPLHWNDEVQNILDDGSVIHWYDKDSIENIYASGKGTALGKVRDVELEEKIDQIEGIIYDSYSQAENIMADAGSVIYGFLSYDKQTSKYRKVVLELSGDWYSTLQDENAEDLINWLRKIHKNIGYPDFK